MKLQNTLVVGIGTIMMGAMSSAAIAADCLVENIQRSDVLIVVNDNSTDSPQLGCYYAQQRGINPANIVHVRTPNNYFLTWTQFRNLRDQLINFMQQNTFTNPSVAPVVCTDGDAPYYCQNSMDQLRQNTRIRYVVTTRGVPTRTTVDGSTLAYASTTSVDNYLKYWLVNYYAQDVSLSSSSRSSVFASGRGMRTVLPSIDRELIVGRIDGLTFDTAKALVDRAVSTERNGVYGKHYGSKYGQILGNAGWRNSSTGQLVYGDTATAWRYQLGLVGENRPECINYLGFPYNQADGNAPQYCFARLTDGADPVQGVANSRAPIADDSLLYLGSLDGQTSGYGSYSNLLNWRKDASCTVTLCENAADPVACRAASTDAFREINTQCVGVADGFLGYNYQSFPVAYMAAWPTGWRSTEDGSYNYLAFPEVRIDTGFDDSYSLWFRNADQIADPRCYTDTTVSGVPTQPCLDERRVYLYQTIPFAAKAVNVSAPQQYKIGFRYKANNITKSATVRIGLSVHEVGAAANIDYGYKDVVALPLGNTDWTYGEVVYTLNPALHTRTDYLFDKIQVDVDTSTTRNGELGLDTFTIQEVGTAIELAQNPSFNQGHKSVSGGDHAANYLSRLNGVAFWGSASHHQSGGHSFSSHPVATLIYFMRGLPLGDAVWFDESYNSGILYGDPIYAPLAIRFNYVANTKNYIAGTVALSGSTVNGRDASLVSTTYNISYCPGSDFFVCDQNAGWLPTGLSGTGGQENMALGAWNTSGLATGKYTLRLAVTSSNVSRGKSQTFYDYYPVTILSPNEDADNDGLTNAQELNNYGTDPFVADTDGDGLLDGVEIQSGTSPNSKVDTDRDGMSDDWEKVRGTDPLNDDARSDPDGDGVDNIIESLRGTLPRDASSAPVLKTVYVDMANTTGVENGTQQSPFSTINGGIEGAAVGDTVSVASGTYSEDFLFISKAVRLLGPSDRSAVVKGYSVFMFSGLYWGEIANMRLELRNGNYINGARNVWYTNCVIHAGYGANLYNAKVRMSKCLLERSAAPGTAKGIGMDATSSLELINTTIADYLTGINVAPGGSLSLRNTILANVTDLVGVSDGSGIRYSLISNGNFAGSNGNLGGDPLFVDRVAGNYHLQLGSPAIDSGDPSSAYAKEPLPNGCRINMGAYGDTAEAEASSDPDGDGIYGACLLITDLSVAVAVSPVSVLVNDNITYSIAVTNKGPSVASGVTMTDPLPAGVTLVSATSTQGTCSGTRTVSCALGGVTRNASAMVTIVVKATATGTRNNVVNVTGAQADPNSANNSATASTAVLGSCVGSSGKDIFGAVKRSNGTAVSGVSITLIRTTAPQCGNRMLTNINGSYKYEELANGSYTVTPAKVGCTSFTPSSGSVSLSGSNKTQNFTGTCP